MADDEEAILKAKLEAAADYDERSRIRRQLRELKKKKSEGQSSSTARRGSSAYRRFSGVAVDNKSTTSTSKSSTLPVKVFGKLDPHREITRTPSPSGSESSHKSTLHASLKAVSPTQPLSEAPARKVSYPQSTGSEEEKENVAAVNGSSPPPPADEVQADLSRAVEGTRKGEDVRTDLEEKGKEKGKEGAQLVDLKEVEERVEEVEEEGAKALPPEKGVEEERVKDLQQEEKVEEETVKELQTEEKEKDVQPDEKVEVETVKESQAEEKEKEVQPDEKVADEWVKGSQPEEKVVEERVKGGHPEEKVEEERRKDIQPEEKVNVATGKEETDFHFRRRAKTEVKPKSSPASSGAAEFQGFKLRKAAAAKETKETKSRPAEKAAEFLGFQLRKTGSTSQKTQGVVETRSQPTVKLAGFQGSHERETNSSVQKAGEMKKTESQPAPKAAGFQGLQGRKAESSAHRSREIEHPAAKTAEFQGFQLRKTDAPTTRSRAQTWGVSAKPPARKAPLSLPKLSDAKELTVAELDSCLDQFVTRVFKFPTNGQPLNTFCKDPRVLCNWINQAVPGTVDLRALTVTKDKRAEEFAREENMTLAVESARSIGCRVMDDTEKRLLNGDSSASRQLVLDLVKARAVNLPGMRDAPEGTFQNPSLLFAVFEIGPVATREAIDGSLATTKPLSTTSAKAVTLPESEKASNTMHDAGMSLKHATTSKQPITTSKEPVPISKEPVRTSKKPVTTSKEPSNSAAASSSAAPDKEAGNSSKDADISTMTDLSYEERAALRRAEREKRKRERAALAAKS